MHGASCYITVPPHRGLKQPSRLGGSVSCGTLLDPPPPPPLRTPVVQQPLLGPGMLLPLLSPAVICCPAGSVPLTGPPSHMRSKPPCWVGWQPGGRSPSRSSTSSMSWGEGPRTRLVQQTQAHADARGTAAPQRTHNCNCLSACMQARQGVFSSPAWRRVIGMHSATPMLLSPHCVMRDSQCPCHAH